MKRENIRRIIAAVAVLIFALAGLAFYSVRDLMAALAMFSVLLLGLGIALLVVLSAEEALVWTVRHTEGYFGRFRARRLALATHSAQHHHFGSGN